MIAMFMNHGKPLKHIFFQLASSLKRIEKLVSSIIFMDEGEITKSPLEKIDLANFEEHPAGISACRSALVGKDLKNSPYGDMKLTNPRKRAKRVRNNADAIDSLHPTQSGATSSDFCPNASKFMSQISPTLIENGNFPTNLNGFDEKLFIYEVYINLDISQDFIDELYTLNTIKFKDPAEWRPNPDDPNMPVAASYRQLILCLTSPDLANVDFQKKFLITYLPFLTPPQVLAALFTRYYADITMPNSNITSPKELKQVRVRIIRIMATWLKLAAYQFTDAMFSTILSFAEILAYDDSAVSNKQLPQILIAAIEQAKGFQSKKYYRAVEYPPIILPSTPPETWEITDIDPEEVARQVTLIHSDVFRKMGSMELLTAIWGTKKGGGAPNLDWLTRQFDIFSTYIEITILNGETPKERAATFQYWAKVGIHFHKMQNFHGLFAVMCALTHRVITRMPDTYKLALKFKDKKMKKKYQAIYQICELSGDYQAYRPALKAATGPCVPFLGCFQRDFIYVQEGFPNTVDGLINFKKSLECERIISEINQYQNEWYPFQKHKAIANLILTINERYQMLDLASLMRLSMAKEASKKK